MGTYDGWCVLLLKDHAEHLHALEPARASRLWEDVMDVAHAVVGALGPGRINYECLGNQAAHVHWHVVPRYGPPRDPDPREAVWTRPRSELSAGVAPARRDRLIHEIREALAARGA